MQTTENNRSQLGDGVTDTKNKPPLKSILQEEKGGLQDLNQVVDTVEDLKQAYIIGDRSTHIAMKNHDSFLIGTTWKGIKLVEKNIQSFCGTLSGLYRSIKDIIYLPSLNCYLIACQNSLYRKDIDNRSPFLYIGGNYGYRDGASFRYSAYNKRLIVTKDKKNIAVINPRTKKKEVEFEKSPGAWINDFRLFRKRDNRIVSVTQDGCLALYSLSDSKMRGVFFEYALDLKEGRKEAPVSVSVWNNSKHVLVELSGNTYHTYPSSRMMVFKLEEDTLVKKAIIDEYFQGIARKYAVDCLGYRGKYILWVGLSWEINGSAQLYAYDTKTEEFVELKEKRVFHHEVKPCKLHRVDDLLYYTGCEGKLMVLTLNR